MSKVLTSEQIDRYEQDGFLHPVQVFTPQEAADLCAALEDAERKHPDALAAAGRNNPHFVFPFLDDIVNDERMLDIVEDLIGPKIKAWGTVLFIKEPNDPGYVSWHQDFTHMGLEPHEGVSAWLALTPSTVETGCMKMIPGTHNDEIHPHHDTFDEDNILTRGQTIHGVDEGKAVDLELQPGEMSLHHPRTIHASAPNKSNQRRIGFTIQSYIPAHVKQTKIQDFKQTVRGPISDDGMTEIPRASDVLAPKDVAQRLAINAARTELLYDGAAKRRDL